MRLLLEHLGGVGALPIIILRRLRHHRRRRRPRGVYAINTSGRHDQAAGWWFPCFPGWWSGKFRRRLERFRMFPPLACRTPGFCSGGRTVTTGLVSTGEKRQEQITDCGFRSRVPPWSVDEADETATWTCDSVMSARKQTWRRVYDSGVTAYDYFSGYYDFYCYYRPFILKPAELVFPGVPFHWY